MPSFLHPALFWTLGLPTLGVVLIPVLIHLINATRHRPIPWAAMEFLQISRKKNRAWVLFKELLLLAVRMAAVAGAIFLFAQPVLRSQWGGLLGGQRTHHVVLLDDSFSMSDHTEDSDVFSEAKQVVRRIADEAAQQSQPQSFTLLRFSRAARPQQAAQPDLHDQRVTPEFIDALDALLDKTAASETAAGPASALASLENLLGSDDGRRQVIYLVSDFRARQWDDPKDIRASLLRLDSAGTEIRLINCIDRTRPNLAIASLAPVDGVCAAGVAWQMEAAVRNFGAAPARNVSLALLEDGRGRPSVAIPEIPPGELATARFSVSFPNAGRHDLVARLESDAVAADNQRYFTIDLPADRPILLIDGDAEAGDARYLSWALAPGGAVRTGLRPQIETPRYLSLKPLDGFLAVNLTNIERLDPSAVEALERYVASGGAAAFFMGENTDPTFVNEALYRGGAGLFPIPLLRPAELPVDRLNPAPDVQTEPHFLFRVFASKRNTFLQTVAVERYFTAPDDWRPPADSTVQIVARLRNGAPLVVEREFGKGRVAAFLTTAAPTWNNWARNPSFVVMVQDLQAHLSQRRRSDRDDAVGAPLELNLDPAAYLPQVRFTSPELGSRAGTVVNAAVAADGVLKATFNETDRAGFYEARLARVDTAAETRRYAINVDAAEGDLTAFGAEPLAARLKGVRHEYQQAAAFRSALGDAPGYNLTEAFLLGLVLLLLAEQILAWSAGYHPAGRRRASEGGAA